MFLALFAIGGVIIFISVVVFVLRINQERDLPNLLGSGVFLDMSQTTVLLLVVLKVFLRESSLDVRALLDLLLGES